MAKYTLETLPLNSLLHLMKKEDLLSLLPNDERQTLEFEAFRKGKKLTKEYLKEWVANRDDDWTDQFENFIRSTPQAQTAFEAYLKNVERLRDPANKDMTKQKRDVLKQAKKGFLGCVATKMDPFDFEECVDDCDKPEYREVALVPRRLRQVAYEKAGLAAPSLDDPGHISFLPRGLRKYIETHPTDYEDYMDERKAEIEFLKTVRRNTLKEFREQKGKGDEEMQEGKRRR